MVLFHKVLVHLIRLVILIKSLQLRAHCGDHDASNFCHIIVVFLVGGYLFRRGFLFVDFNKFLLKDIVLILESKGHLYVTHPAIIDGSIQCHV